VKFHHEVDGDTRTGAKDLLAIRIAGKKNFCFSHKNLVKYSAKCGFWRILAVFSQKIQKTDLFGLFFINLKLVYKI
jgi:hypothetical protein